MEPLPPKSIPAAKSFEEQAARLKPRGKRWRLLQLWFPQVLLALALGILGIFQILPKFFDFTGFNPLSPEIYQLASNLGETSFQGIPQGLLGVLLLVMALALLTRSRIAWVGSFLITLVLLAIEIAPPGYGRHPLLTGYIALVLVLLVLGFRKFNRSNLGINTLFAVVTALLLLSYAVVGSYILGDFFNPPIQNFVTALYFSVVTMATVGYGDILPKTDEAKLFVVSIVILGVSFFATAFSTILVPLIHKRIQSLLRPGEETMSRQNHYIIVGDSSLARNTLKELKTRELPVTVILPHAPDEKSLLNHDDIVVGDPTDLEILKAAQADKAEAILALSQDDSDNAFVVMAAKELGVRARTVAAVNDAKNMKRMSRVNPDLIVAPEVLGAELLAMAMSGEPVDVEKLLSRLLHFKGAKHPA